jgi:endonuclease/exonuclease/phosphatase family metal-dependent hydrolase
VLYTSKNVKDIVYSNLGRKRPGRVKKVSKHPKLTAAGLKYTTTAYYYRIETKNGSHKKVSSVFKAHLAPAVPANVQLVHPSRGGHGLALTWDVESALGFQVVQTETAPTHSRKVYTLDGNASQFTPYGLTKGATYSFSVRARNGTTPSKFAPAKVGTFTGNQLSFKVLTWNVLHMMFDGSKENGGTIASWHKRLKVVISMINGADPDLININEASDWYNHAKHIRQIDTIAKNLPGYTLCSADTMPDPRIGNYLLIRKSMFDKLNPHGRVKVSGVSGGNWVNYQTIRSKTTGAKFVAFSVHLSPGSNARDKTRDKETQILLAHAKSLVASGRDKGLPIMYLGDFNSFSGTSKAFLDSPEQRMRAADVADALVAAQTRTNTRYGSVNNYTRVPNKSGRIIDHIFGTSGVAFSSWRQIMHLRHGRWPGTIPSDHNPVSANVTIQY